MKQPFLRTVPQRVSTRAHFAVCWAVLLLLVAATGCQTQRPTSLVIAPQTVPAPEPRSGTGVSLRLATFNIWGLPSWMTGAPHGRYPRIAQELERLDPDIVLLQEAWTAAARKAVPANGHWSIARAAGQHTFFQQNGLVTLSKYPILGGQFYPFPHASMPDSLVSKGLLKVTVRLPGGEVLNIWNTHLQDGGAAEVRKSQVREIISRVEAAEDGQIADLVGGDFNTTPDSPLYAELVAALGPSVQQLSGQAPFVTWDGMSGQPGSGQTFDHIFIRSRTVLDKVETTQRVAFTSVRREQRLSDHFGIEAVVALCPVPSLAKTTGPLFEGPTPPEGRPVFAGGN